MQLEFYAFMRHDIHRHLIKRRFDEITMDRSTNDGPRLKKQIVKAFHLHTYKSQGKCLELFTCEFPTLLNPECPGIEWSVNCIRDVMLQTEVKLH